MTPSPGGRRCWRAAAAHPLTRGIERPTARDFDPVETRREVPDGRGDDVDLEAGVKSVEQASNGIAVVIDVVAVEDH
jgi:hypothetical protein